ncbi:MAG TPA: PAS domain S-box protein, partial [Ktedonobacteraceae bacterium]|nr:PAS domain S-box protein [Ktedonobacteraceae bacterium]
MHPVDLTTNLPSSSDAQGNVGQEQAEYSVQEPQVLNATILEHITEAFFALDLQWRITYCNEKAASLTPRTRQELLGKNLWESFPEIVGSTFYHRCQKAVATGNAEQLEARTRHQKWIRIHIFPSPDDITIFLSDITAQKQVQEQEQFQANILRHIRDSVIVTDLQGKITYWNEGAGCIFGYTPDEMIGHTIARLYPDYDVTHLDHTAAKLELDLLPIADGEDSSSEWQGRRKDGTLIWVDVKMTLLRSANDEACGYIGVAKDITRRKHLDEELQRSKDQLEVILRNVDDGIIVQNAIGEIIYANHQIATRAGYASAEEMLAALPSAYWERVELTDEQGHPFLLSQLPGRRALHEEANPQVSIRYVNK